MAKAPNLVGQRFGRLLVVKRQENNADGQATWKCKCDCGLSCIRKAGQLRLFAKRGRRQSCGCWRDELAAERRRAAATHGLTTELAGIESHKLYDVWRQMLRRCENKRCKDFPSYGARGIRVCKAWHDPNKFLRWCWASGYEVGLTIERRDVNGNYTPSNCTWTPNPLQSKNMRKNRTFTFNGRTLCISEWSRYLGIHVQTLLRRLRHGWTVEQTLSLRPGQARI